MDRKVLILGAMGRFGLAAVNAFSSAGWKVVAQVRATRAVDDLPAISGVRWLPLSLDELNESHETLTGVAVVINALNPPYTNAAWTEQAPVMMRKAIQLAAASNATLMLPGNVYNFGERMPALLREDTPQQVKHTKGRVRVALEQQLEAAAKEGKVRAVVIRAGDFFGSGRGSMFDLVLTKNLPKAVMTLAGSLTVATPWVYLPDLAKVFVCVAEQRHALAAFEIFHVAGHTLNGNDWLNVLSRAATTRGWMRESLTQKLGISHFPWWLIRLAASVVPICRSLADMRYLGQRPHALDNSKLLGLLGSEPRTPLEIAVPAALEDLFPEKATFGSQRAL